MSRTPLYDLCKQSLRPPLSEDLLTQTRTALIRKEIGERHVHARLIAIAILQTSQVQDINQRHRALACDAISTWMIRSSNSDSLREAIAGIPGIWELLVGVVFTSFDDADGGLAKALKDLFLHVITRADSVLWIARKAVEGGKSRKVGYYVLQALLKRGIGAEWVFLENPRVVEDMLFALKDRMLAPVIGKALVTLLDVRKKEVSQDLPTWMEIWEAPLNVALRCEEVRGNVQIYALPGLFRLSQECFVGFVQGLGLKRCGQGDEEDLMSLLCCLKVGRDLGFVDEINDTTDENGHFSKLQLPSSLVSPLLSHAHQDVRLSALALTTYSSAHTKPLPSSAFRILKSTFAPLHAETDASARNLVISNVRQLIERLGSSSYALSKDPVSQQLYPTTISDVASFMDWYLWFLKVRLAPGGGYQRVVTALRVLAILIRSGVDPSMRDAGRKKKGLLNWPESFRVNIFDDTMNRVLLDCLFNPFDDIRGMAAEVLKLSRRCCGSALDVVIRRGLKEMDRSGRASDADGVARAIEIWFQCVRDRSGDPGGVMACEIHATPAHNCGVSVFDWVLDLLEGEYLKVARADLQRAVKERPVHGLLAGMRYVLERKDVYEGASRSGRRRAISRILRYCEEIWDLAKGVLCYDSPEGYVPEGMMDEDGDGEDEMDTQTVMSYCWRAVKESSALLGTILSTAPYDPVASSLLSKEDFSNAGSLLLAQLSEIRHRGAFSAVSPSFISLCARCLKTPTLSDLPRKWLSENLSQIITKSNTITRRSAGLPSLIVGILIAEPGPTRPLLAETFKQLEYLARKPAISRADGGKMDLPQVHALNCLKLLFTDSRLSSASQELLGRGLELAVGCFASEVWAVRNCGIMLFTALSSRLFGKKMTGKVGVEEFLDRYPGVAGVLLGSLPIEGDGSVERVYPALSLIARLEFTEGFDASVIEPAVVRCLSSRVWKVREMAARSYSTLIGPTQVAGVVGQLLSDAVESGKQNVVHGKLCAVGALLERRGVHERGRIWGSFCRAWKALVEANNCAVTKSLFLSLVLDYGVAQGLLVGSSDDTIELGNILLTYCNTPGDTHVEISSASSVGRSLLKEQLARHVYYLSAHSVDSKQTLLALLSGSDEDLSLYTANLLHSSRIDFDQDTLKRLDLDLWKIVTAHPWDQLRTVVIELMIAYPPPEDTSASTLRSRCQTLLTLCKSAATEPCRIAALPTLATLTALLYLKEPTTSLDPLLQLALSSAQESNPFDIRYSALSAIAALSPVLSFKAYNAAYLCLYDLLHDDDEDIRLAAAGVTKSITRGQYTLVPEASADALVQQMSHRFNTDEVFYQDVVGRLGIPACVKDELRKTCAGRGRELFACEKQNLFVDTAAEVVRWAQVLAELPGNEGVVRDVRVAVAELREVVVEMGDEGPMGWMTGEEAWIMACRVVEGVGVVRTWKGGECEVVREEGRKLLEEMELKNGHGVLVGRLREVLGVV